MRQTKIEKLAPKAIRTLILLFLSLILFSIGSTPYAQGSPAHQGLDYFSFLPLIRRGIGVPTLKWQRGGCTSWCQTGWYSSPAVINIDGDPQAEVIASAYSIWALDGVSGATQWTYSHSGRTWPGIALADIDDNGSTEIIAAKSGPAVVALRLDGSLVWSVAPSGSSNEFRGLLVADLDGNSGPMEILATRAAGSNVNAWVLNANGSIRAGWPQMSSDTYGYSWGVYNNNAAAGNLDGDAQLELIIPSDVHYVNALNPDGSSILANQTLFPGKYWGRVGMWESQIPENRGWGECDGVRSESYRTNFADGPAVIADVNDDGSREVILTGNMYDCDAGYPPSRYVALYIFNADRSRFNTGGYDWRTIPIDTGAPLSEDYNVIESHQANPAVADLDNDGKMEILFSSYDGRVHAFWLDKTEHGSWPYSVYQPSEGFYRFASEPLVADLDHDGPAEVIFTSWTQKGSNRAGKLHILSALGQVIHEVDLPLGSNWDGAMAAPTLANIDTDPDLEIVINTAHSGVVAFDLPGTAGARILWGTGRGDYTRKASR